MDDHSKLKIGGFVRNPVSTKLITGWVKKVQGVDLITDVRTEGRRKSKVDELVTRHDER